MRYVQSQITCLRQLEIVVMNIDDYIFALDYQLC
jgi:hypothetical protein